jgi:ABC-type uncharacterized transport system substrate-binding protein
MHMDSANPEERGLRLILAKVAFGALSFAASTIPAAAHPHVFVDAKSEMVFAGGKLTAIRHIWQFDETFTSYAVQGLDQNGDGKLSDAELAPLAKVNVESLGMFGFFTRLSVDGSDVAFAEPTEYWLEFRNRRLTLFYALPLKSPVAVMAAAKLDVSDPEYFVGFTYVQDDPVTLVGAPAACKTAFRPPQQLDPRTMALLSSIPANQAALPPALRSAASALANEMTVTCK